MNTYWVLTIPVGCRRPDEAWKLLRSLATPEMDAITASSCGTATRRDTWSRPDVRGLASYYASLELAHGSARAIPRDPRWPAMSAILNDMMRDAVERGNGMQALDVAHARLEALLAQSA